MAIIYGTGFNDNNTFQIIPTPGLPLPPQIGYFPQIDGTAFADEIYALKMIFTTMMGSTILFRFSLMLMEKEITL